MAREPLKLIYQTGGPDDPDDPSYPFRLYVNLASPELMQVTFIMLYGGSEEAVIRGETREALQAIVNEAKAHPRFRRLSITGPDGFQERFPP